jgi:predicted aldo/keto reductase-like oxidoreductase
MQRIRYILIGILMLTLIFTIGCSAQKPEISNKTFTEQDIRQAITGLIDGINSGDINAVEKYVGSANFVAKILVEKLNENIKLSNVRDIKIQGTSAQATVTLEVVPLKVNKDITLNFNMTDVLLLDNPLGLLSLLL